MRTSAAAALSLLLLAAPAFARARSPAAAKAPQAGAFCAKAALGTSSQDKSGAALECKADKKGKARWTKK